MFQYVGRFCASHPWIVCAIWLVVGVTLMVAAPSWDARTQDDDVRFLPERCPSVRAYQILEKAFPKDVFASRLIFAVEREETPLTPGDFVLVDKMVGDLEKLRKESPDLQIGSIVSYQDGLIGSRLTSEDKKCTLIQVSLGTPFLALQTQATVTKAQEVLTKRIEEAGKDAPKLFTTGQAGMGRDLVTATGDSLDETTWATILLVIVVLLMVYRSPLLALIPLITIATSVWVAMSILAFLTMIPGVHLVNISKVFAIVILYGAGTDYCLFLISRYREELESGSTTKKALRLSVGSVGGALVASAGTVMCGLGLMALAEFAKVRYSGPGIALSLGVALLAALTLTPALLKILGNIVFWPRSAPQPRRPYLVNDFSERKQGIWGIISSFVVARPGLVFVLSFGLLLPLAVLGFQVKPDYRATNQLSQNSESLKGIKVIQKHFTAGETGPLTVLLVSKKSWDSPTGRNEIDHLTRGFKRIKNVAEVRSLTHPLGKPIEEYRPKKSGMSLLALVRQFQPNLVSNFMDKAKKASLKHYVSSIPAEDGSNGEVLHVTRLDVILETDPFAPESQETMQTIQTWLNKELPKTTFMPAGLRGETYGVMVSSFDLADVTESDRVRVNSLICLGILLILILIVRSPILAVYLLITVLFSYYATLGATILAGYIWSGEIVFHLDWRVLFFLFVILVAVGEDYNILLMSRAVQEQRRLGPIEGMRRALGRTGGTITSCGLIMAGTFATLMLANLTTLMQIGFALAFGVLVDTFIVRPFLVPTFAIFLARTKEADPVPEAAEEKEDSEVDKKLPPAYRLAG